jgi:broad specificity phosphatase PhoE
MREDEAKEPTMAKYLELRRHTDNDGDMLSADGVETALEIGRTLHGSYHLGVSSGAQRATQTLANLFVSTGAPVPRGVVVEPGLRSAAEDRWREIAGQAQGSTLTDFRAVDGAFVDEEARTLASALRRVLDLLEDEQRALVVGHTPTTEAGVYGLTGEEIAPLAKGGGILLVADGQSFRLEQLVDPQRS